MAEFEEVLPESAPLTREVMGNRLLKEGRRSGASCVDIYYAGVVRSIALLGIALMVLGALIWAS